jgi:two-component sensor histidine kinase
MGIASNNHANSMKSLWSPWRWIRRPSLFLRKAIEGRIKALANVHSLFVEARWIGAELSTIATQGLAPYFATGDNRVCIDGPQVMLEPTTAQALAVALHELATNAAKNGSLSAENGHVDLKWPHEANGRLSLRWTETGGLTVAQRPTRKGFGGRIIDQMIGQLKGEKRFEWRAEGLVCEINLRAWKGAPLPYRKSKNGDLHHSAKSPFSPLFHDGTNGHADLWRLSRTGEDVCP